MDKSHRSLKLYCFTPEVSLATFLIEVLIAGYIFFRYKSSLFQTLCILVVLSLGFFQLGEFLVCKTSDAVFWAKISYSATTCFPALGMHLTYVLTKKKRVVMVVAYVLLAVFQGIIFLLPPSALFAVCQPNYVHFHLDKLFGISHAIYYSTFLLIAIIYLLNHTFIAKKYAWTAFWLFMSYVVFLMPTYVLYFLNYFLYFAIPSVMCGFALLTAILLIGLVLPNYKKQQ